MAKKKKNKEMSRAAGKEPETGIKILLKSKAVMDKVLVCFLKNKACFEEPFHQY